MRSGVFAGTFDPVHFGHLHVIESALKVLDVLHIVIANNSSKKTRFDGHQRETFVWKACKEAFPNVAITKKPEPDARFRQICFHDLQTGLLINYARTLGAQCLVRGVRNATDCSYELNIAQVNHALNSDIPTLIIPTPAELSYVSSSVVRELLDNFGNLVDFVPAAVIPHIR